MLLVNIILQGECYFVYYILETKISLPKMQFSFEGCMYCK